MTYDKQVRLVLDRQQNELAIILEFMPHYYKVVDSRVFNKMLDVNNVISRPLSNPSLLNFSKQELNTFLGYCQTIKSVNVGLVTNIQVLKKKAIELIAIIKKENRLK
jgi:hypothetical protein